MEYYLRADRVTINTYNPCLFGGRMGLDTGGCWVICVSWMRWCLLLDLFLYFFLFSSFYFSIGERFGWGIDLIGKINFSRNIKYKFVTAIVCIVLSFFFFFFRLFYRIKSWKWRIKWRLSQAFDRESLHSQIVYLNNSLKYFHPVHHQ